MIGRLAYSERFQQFAKGESIDEQSPHWRSSSYKGIYEVEAANEAEARCKATKEFHMAAKKLELGEGTPLSPWESGDLVSCERVE
jgi:hypothetical protein